MKGHGLDPTLVQSPKQSFRQRRTGGKLVILEHDPILEAENRHLLDLMERLREKIVGALHVPTDGRMLAGIHFSPKERRLQ